MDLYREARLFPKTLGADTTLIRAVDLADHGITANAAWWRTAHGRMTRPHRGLYVPRAGALDLLDRARAALAVASPDAVVGYHTAAALLGFGVVESPDVHLIVPSGKRFPQRAGIVAHQSVVPVDEPAWVHGVPCSPPARTAIDLARAVNRYDGLATLDAALFCAACTPEQLADELVAHGGLKGVKRAEALVPLADGRAACRQETRLRLILVDAGFMGFEPQVAVWDGGEWPRYFLDLADRRYRIAAEYDGSSHLSRERMRDDRDRHNFLSHQGWDMRYFTDQDIYRRPGYIITTIAAAYRSASPRSR